LILILINNVWEDYIENKRLFYPAKYHFNLNAIAKAYVFQYLMFLAGS